MALGYEVACRVGIYGGNVLNSLKKNVCVGKEQTAQDLKELITNHKSLWIDEVISERDQLVHPTRGAHQLMFQLELENSNGVLIFKEAHPPHVGSESMDTYSVARLKNIREFANGFIAALRSQGSPA